MQCSCKNDRTNKMGVICLNRCTLPKHKCLDREDIRPGPVPKKMGWLYTARDSPEHQLRCGWRPGHISCPVLKRIEAHNCMSRDPFCFPSPCVKPCFKPCVKPSPCYKVCCKPTFKPCYTPCPKPCYKPCYKPCKPSKSCYKSCLKSCCSPGPPCLPSSCSTPCRGTTPCNTPCITPLIRIIRHGGKYSIVTEPSNITNHPSGPYPLKYVLNTDESTAREDPKVKFSVEAKFNDYHFDYTSSQSSFVLDFSPPEGKCFQPCCRRSSVCLSCQNVSESASLQPPSEESTADKKGR